nr:MAG TPA: hypothetical protein [Caudoviricetes sp.]
MIGGNFFLVHHVWLAPLLCHRWQVCVPGFSGCILYEFHYWIGTCAGRDRSAGGIAFLPDAGNGVFLRASRFTACRTECPAVGPDRPVMTGTVNNKIQKKKILWDS